VTHSDKVKDLITFLVANVDVANLDGRPDKAVGYSEMLDTVRNLSNSYLGLRRAVAESSHRFDPSWGVSRFCGLCGYDSDHPAHVDFQSMSSVLSRVQELHEDYFNVSETGPGEGIEPEDVWRFDRDLRLAMDGRS